MSFKIGGNVMKYVLALIGSITVIFMSSCATKGYMEAVKERASFDMDCDEVDTKLLGGWTHPTRYLSEASIGVIGCDKRQRT
jgi:hypothetical protein